MERFLITCHEKGVFIGSYNAQLIWSSLGPKDCSIAITFSSVSEAVSFLRENNLNTDLHSIIRVIPDFSDRYASIGQCKKSGANIEGWQNHLNNSCPGASDVIYEAIPFGQLTA